MGRGKLILKLIENEKSRMTTYQKRKRGLKKKAEEFATLCGVPTCMIIYGPKLKNRPPEVEVWPQEASEFMEVVNLYRDKGYSPRGIKAYNLFDFFDERKRKVNDKFNKLRKSNLESKFPSCWDDRLNSLSLDQLRVLLSTFDNNIEVATRRIVTIKGDNDHDHDHDHQVLISKNIEIGDLFNNKQPKPLDHHHHHNHNHQNHAMQLYQPPLQVRPYHDPFDNNPNENQMMIGSTGDQFGGGGSGGGNGAAAAYGQVLLQPAAFCFDPTAVIVDNVMINNQRAMYFCSPHMQTLQHYEQCPPPLLPSSNISSSQMVHSSSHQYHHHHLRHHQFNEFYRDINEFGIKNERGKN